MIKIFASMKSCCQLMLEKDDVYQLNTGVEKQCGVLRPPVSVVFSLLKCGKTTITVSLISLNCIQ